MQRLLLILAVLFIGLSASAQPGMWNTKSKKAMVKYATTAKENVFVNEYLINLPSKSELEKIVKKWMKNN